MINETLKQEALDTTESDASVSIALVMTPPWEAKMPPLGLAHLSSFLKANGVKTKIADLNVKLFNKADATKKYLWSIDTINEFATPKLGECFRTEFEKEIDDFVCEMSRSEEKIIGFSTTVASVNVALHIAHQIKRKAPSKIIILGGPGVFWDTEFIDPQQVIDAFVIGEGETPLLEIIRRVQKNSTAPDLHGIPGTCVYIKDQYRTFSAPASLKNIDAIPVIDFSGFDITEYSAGGGYQPLPILMSRGCINRCAFCVDHKLNQPFRTRNPHKVVGDLNYCVQKFGRYDFEFNDLLCNGNLKQLEEVCDLIIKEGLNIRWTSYAAIRKGMTSDLLKKMKKAGCYRLCYGMESASDLVLKKMNKPYNAQMAEQVIRDTHNAGIQSAFNVIIGYPGESKKEFNETCDFIKRNAAFIDEITNVSTCFLIVGSDLVSNLDKYGVRFKRPLKETLKIIFKMQRCPCADRIFYRQFYSRPGNSPDARAKRLREMLTLIARLEIPTAVINRTTEDDPNFNQFKKKLRKTNFSRKPKKPIRIHPDPGVRAIHLYSGDQQVTSNIGLSTAFLVGEKWADSSGGKWEIEEESGRLSIMVFFPDIPVSQEWVMNFEGRTLTWDVKTKFCDRVLINQQKQGLIVPLQYIKYTSKDSFLNFPEPAEAWAQADYLRSKKIQLVSSAHLPSIILKQEGWWRGRDFIQIENFPKLLQSRMINFCLIDPSKVGENGHRGRLFKKGHETRRRIEITLEQAL